MKRTPYTEAIQFLEHRIEMLDARINNMVLEAQLIEAIMERDKLRELVGLPRSIKKVREFNDNK